MNIYRSQKVSEQIRRISRSIIDYMGRFGNLSRLYNNTYNKSILKEMENNREVLSWYKSKNPRKQLQACILSIDLEIKKTMDFSLLLLRWKLVEQL